jgi:hypothetical protein
MILPPILDIGVKENSHFNSSKISKSRLASSAGGREDPKTPLYSSNFITFTNVPTPISDHHLVHVC